eukprot:CAMPEP_0198124866 /NCGR_PEP_ID=MMETSP1442-20131203/41099_1 /TAXON_ID= /ORGANISM="Craspedostauros australis, Strain CCMP3328" /LENGTH=158 /DNA_ID=CAMNT_0043784359 /DNA_START=188 /DNA_END=664 /DNA_ORIENTATION=+
MLGNASFTPNGDDLGGGDDDDDATLHGVSMRYSHGRMSAGRTLKTRASSSRSKDGLGLYLRMQISTESDASDARETASSLVSLFGVKLSSVSVSTSLAVLRLTKVYCDRGVVLQTAQTGALPFVGVVPPLTLHLVLGEKKVGGKVAWTSKPSVSASDS